MFIAYYLIFLPRDFVATTLFLQLLELEFLFINAKPTLYVSNLLCDIDDISEHNKKLCVNLLSDSYRLKVVCRAMTE